MIRRTYVLAVSAGLLLSACSKTESSAPTPVADTKPDTKPAAEPPKAAHTPEPPKMGNDGLPSDIPATRSAVPKLDEWAAQTKEITVARSTPLGCETKMVREWLRVSCHGKNDKGGEPTTVDNKTGGGGEHYLFAKNKVTSLVMPVLRGQKYEAVFAWTDKKQVLVVEWPSGAPSPTIKFTDPLVSWLSFVRM